MNLKGISRLSDSRAKFLATPSPQFEQGVLPSFRPLVITAVVSPHGVNTDGNPSAGTEELCYLTRGNEIVKKKWLYHIRFIVLIHHLYKHNPTVSSPDKTKSRAYQGFILRQLGHPEGFRDPPLSASLLTKGLAFSGLRL